VNPFSVRDSGARKDSRASDIEGGKKEKKMNRHFAIAFTLFVCLLVPGLVEAASPLGPGFTYQGEIRENDSPVNGSVHLRFSLWDAEADGAVIGASQTLTDIPVIEGLFTVILNASGEFGPTAFNGEGRWLQIEKCADGLCASPTALNPRQRLTATPYTHNALSAPWNGLTDIPAGFADGVDNSADSVWGVTETNVFYEAGKVGIGTATPHHQLRISGGPNWTSNLWVGSLELDNAAAIGWQRNTAGRGFGIGHTNEGLFFFNTESDPGTKLLPADYAMTIANGGQVGIGSTMPHHQLRISGGPFWTSDGWIGSLELDNIAAIGWRSNAGGRRFGIGQSLGGLYFFHTSGDPGTATSAANYDMVIADSGSVGIGTFSPAPGTKLNVVTDAAANYAIRGDAPNGSGVVGSSAAPGNAATAGLHSANNGIGVYGEANAGDLAYGVHGKSVQGTAVYGVSDTGVGLRGVSTSNTGVTGTSSLFVGVRGSSSASNSAGVDGESPYIGVEGRTSGDNPDRQAVRGDNFNSATGYAGIFVGNVLVTGLLTKSSGSFLIDHPMDPHNKYLSHSSVESPDMKNVYDGNATTDATGYAKITLPDYFEALNKDFRYQLTVIGDFAQAVVSKEIEKNAFEVKTDRPNVKVSWQVTGIRQDAWAKAHPTVVEKEKSEAERGKYLAPEVYGQSKEMGIGFRPENEASPNGVDPAFSFK
jgi:hypothetical protein